MNPFLRNHLPFQLILFLFCSSLLAQNKYEKQAIILRKVIQQKHYRPRPVDDGFSASLFSRFIDDLDHDKLFFTASDIKALEKFRFQLDDELNGKGWNFLPAVSAIYKKRLQNADTIVSFISQKAFDFSLTENFSVSTNEFPSDENAIVRRWQQFLKWRTLEKLFDVAESEKSLKGKYDKKNVLLREPEFRKKIASIEKRNILLKSSQPGGIDEYLANIYCSVLAHSFDPHTDYMPPVEKENFVGELSTEKLSFGLSLQEKDNGEISIGKLVPGAPAWQSNQLSKGDVLLQLQWEGQPKVDLAGASREEVSTVLKQENHSKLNMTVKKADGQVKTVPLIKQRIRVDDALVKGFLLKGSKKMGYISLPDFYSDWENPQDGLGCANDVAKEIVKLKKENIEALILDLRYNGGGSMKEAIELSGIFIDAGAVSLFRSKDKKTFILKDVNRGTIFDGPLIIMINGQSASASEMVAGTLQDHRRALIVGSSSYGKATSQQIFPVDSSSEDDNSVLAKEYGYVKITSDKLYRITGKTAQHAGVQPDIALPDFFEALNFREAADSLALPADTVMKNVLYNPLPPLPIAPLQQKSRARIDADSNFKAIKDFTSWLREAMKEKDKPIPLKWELYEKEIGEGEDKKDGIREEMDSVSRVFTAENASFDKEKINSDDFLKELNEYWTRKIVSDIYIEETYRIACDLINESKPKL